MNKKIVELPIFLKSIFPFVAKFHFFICSRNLNKLKPKNKEIVLMHLLIYSKKKSWKQTNSWRNKMYCYKTQHCFLALSWELADCCNQLLQLVIVYTINFELYICFCLFTVFLYLKGCCFVMHVALTKPRVPLFKAVEVLLEFAWVTSENALVYFSPK